MSIVFFSSGCTSQEWHSDGVVGLSPRGNQPYLLVGSIEIRVPLADGVFYLALFFPYPG